MPSTITEYYYVQQGESIVVPLDLLEGDISEVSSIESQIRATPYRPISAEQATDIVGDLDPVPITIGGAGWHLTMAETFQLQLGWHVIDARLLIGGLFWTTDPVAVRILKSVTGPSA